MTSLAILGLGEAGWGGLLAAAALMTLAVTLASLAFGAVLGAGFAAMKLSPSLVLRATGEAYTTLFRGVPELLIIYVIYFGGSNAVTAVGHLLGGSGFVGFPAFAAGTVAVGAISGAYQTEIFRGAYRAIARGEIEAALSVGMGRALRLRRVVVPQVLRFALPGLGNVFQLTLKDSALVSVTGLAELMRTSQIAAGSTHRYLLFYAVGAALYLVLTSASDRAFGLAERRVRRSFRSAS